MSGDSGQLRKVDTSALDAVKHAPQATKPASAWGHRFAIGGGVLLLGIAIIGALGLLHTYGPQFKYPTEGFNHFLEALGDKGQIALTAVGGVLGIGLTIYGIIRRRQFIQDEAKAEVKEIFLKRFFPLQKIEKFKNLKEGHFDYEKRKGGGYVVVNEKGTLLRANLNNEEYQAAIDTLLMLDYKDAPVILTLPSGDLYEMTKTERNELFNRFEKMPASEGNKYMLEKGTYTFNKLDEFVLCDSDGIYTHAKVKTEECGKCIALHEQLGYKPAKAKDEKILANAEAACNRLKSK